MLSEKFAKNMFVVSTLTLFGLGVFCLGAIFTILKPFPYTYLYSISQHVSTYIKTGGIWAPAGLYVRAPSGTDRTNPFIVHDKKLVLPGYRAILGWDHHSDHYRIWLINHLGENLHSWAIDYHDFIGEKVGDQIINPQGMYMLEDGSVLIASGTRGRVLARLDACSRPVWLAHGIYHHSIDLDENSDIWTWQADYNSIGQHQNLVKLDLQTGEVLTRIDLIDDLLSQDDKIATIMGVPGGYRYETFEGIDPPVDKDLFHPNDVESLHTNMAAFFPQFVPGDLLISLRNIHLVAVLNPVTKQLKWWSHGPWRFQHDPDFASDGKIYVYNNNSYRGRSDIISIDPKSMEVTRYFAQGATKFYTIGRGEHTLLPDGTIQIVVPEEGRFLESRRSGEPVIEFNNIVNEEFNGDLVNVVWLPEDFYQSPPKCIK